MILIGIHAVIFVFYRGAEAEPCTYLPMANFTNPVPFVKLNQTPYITYKIEFVYRLMQSRIPMVNTSFDRKRLETEEFAIYLNAPSVYPSKRLVNGGHEQGRYLFA